MENDILKYAGELGNCRIFKSKYNGLEITFKLFPSGEVDALLDDNFAKTNGYKDLSDMQQRNASVKEAIRLYGYMPKWVIVYDNGEMRFKAVKGVGGS